MNTLDQKRILLGVTGGIAAYKAAELCRRLTEAGAQVRVAMTQAAQAFVGPLTFQALSGQPVHTELMDPGAEAAMGHIALARWAQAVLIAPCTADFMAKLAQGRADDLLSTLCLATRAPISLAPSMNPQMWSNPATQHNRQRLIEHGIRLLGPAHGDMACGEIGEGRMLEPGAIVEQLNAQFCSGVLQGLHVMITAGPTREAIDPVRYISNRSSGRMGYALARAAREAGARVSLISGPVALDAPQGVECIAVESAAQMHEAVMSRLAQCDVLIAAAAVSDYRVAHPAAQKIKKDAATVNLALALNPDIVAEAAAHTPRPFVVGFAAETQQMLAHAREKLLRKGLDMIAANQVGPNQGFECEDNALHVLWRTGEAQLALSDKNALARQLIALIAQHIPPAFTDNETPHAKN